ncbi:AbiJ-NTD4 domain-containing protein [uncultured Alistipes sp.]|uniref:AbiJ-NTD4 domain-containing protein n=1 Tax=uncultured Alistipes sp. TaxID=538949 RepID=UPI00320916CF
MSKQWFAERNGYKKVDDVLVRERLTEPFMNGIVNMYIQLFEQIRKFNGSDNLFLELDKYIHAELLKRDLFSYEDLTAIFNLLRDRQLAWYELFSLLECSWHFFFSNRDYVYAGYIDKEANRIFERENYAYRMNHDTGDIIEVTSEMEIDSINEALRNPVDSVRTHIETAIKHLSASQKAPDYRNSVKESISAVEACCRNITGETTLDKAIARLEAKGVVINSEMKKGFAKLYYYTNDEATGIRHALMDNGNVPTSDEAIYMLVVCSAFVNYLTKKNIQ